MTLIRHKDWRLEEWQTDAAALRRPVSQSSVFLCEYESVHKETAFRPASRLHYVILDDLNHIHVSWNCIQYFTANITPKNE